MLLETHLYPKPKKNDLQKSAYLINYSLKVQSCKLYNNKYVIALTQIANNDIFASIAVHVLKLLSCKVLFTNRTDNRNC